MLLRTPLDAQSGQHLQLITEIDANHAERCVHPHAGPDVVQQIAESPTLGVVPYVPGFGKQDSTQVAHNRESHLCGGGKETFAAHRGAGR